MINKSITALDKEIPKVNKYPTKGIIPSKRIKAGRRGYNG
jgi:hypothetical protein|tara:strand:- start:3196 stop:3315 length:120 start_codon:yes stop_codon:yes gene_type:complete